MSNMPPPPPPPSSWGQQPPGYPAYSGGPSADYAGFGARLGALIIDSLIGGLFALPAVLVFIAGPKTAGTCTVNDVTRDCQVPTLGTIGLGVLLGIVGNLAFLIIYCRKVAAGQSWGQKVTGVRIVDASTGGPISAGRVFGRQLVSALSGCVCYLGFLWMLWDSRKQTWHDKIVGTVVVRA